jgi:hypothetical protein
VADGRRPGLRLSLSAVLAVAFLLAAQPSAAGTTSGPVDWTRYAGETTIEVVSTDADGSRRETTVWMVVVEGRAFVRTGNTHWGDNVASRPDVLVRIGAEEIPVRAELVKDASVQRVVEEAFRTKYGWEDRLVSSVFRSVPRIFHLEPRGSSGAAQDARPTGTVRPPGPGAGP